MRILHLPDLLVHEESTRLRYLDDDHLNWLRGRLDVVVITGDLTASGSATEFQRLSQLLTDLLEHLPNKDKRRLVVVPGNHDVDRRSTGTQVASFPEDDPLAIQNWVHQVRQYKQNPGSSPLRIQISAAGHLRWWKREEHEPDQRLKNFLDWSADFYATVPGVAPFSSRHPHWCCHRLEEHQCIVLGWFTGAQIDEFWDGASVDSTMVTEARDFMEDSLRIANQSPSDYTIIGAWHHGFTGHRARPDRLSMRDLLRLKHARVDVGLYGHHAEEAMPLDLQGRRMILAGVGRMDSVGADSEWNASRHDAFAYLVLSRRSLRWELRNGVGSQGLLLAKNLRLRLRPRDHAHWIERQTWTFTVGDSGITTVDVAFEGLSSAPTSIPLMMVPHPYARVVTSNETTGGELRPEPTQRRFRRGQGQSDEERLVLVLEEDVDQASTRLLAAGLVALSAADLDLLPDRQAEYPQLTPMHEAVTTTVRVATGTLVIRLVWVCKEFEPPEIVSPYVERPLFRSGQVVLQREVEDESRLWSDETLRETDQDGQIVWEMRVDGPALGWRYGLAFPPSGDPPDVGPEFEEVSRALLDLAASGPRALTVGAEIREETESVLEEHLGAALSDHTHWTFYALDRSSHSLIPVLSSADGHIPRSFDVGEGVVGHSVRMGKHAGWHVQPRGELNPAFVPSEAGTPTPRWIVALPLFVKGVASGVLGIAATEASSTQADAILETYARSKEHAQRVNDLAEAWTAKVLATLATTPRAAGPLQSAAHAALQEVGRSPTPAPARELEADVFLSFSSADRERAQEVARELESSGIRLWRWHGDLRSIDELEHVVAKGIRAATVVVDLVSRSWLDSPQHELTIHQEDLHRIPIQLEPDLDLPAALASVPTEVALHGDLGPAIRNVLLALHRRPSTGLLIDPSRSAKPHPDGSWDIFLAHAKVDRERVIPIRDALLGHAAELGTDLRLFFDETSVKAGEEWSKSIPDALERSRKFVVCVSQHGESPYLRDEINLAIRLRRQDKLSIVQVFLDAGARESPPYGLGPFHGIDGFDVPLNELATKILD